MTDNLLQKISDNMPNFSKGQRVIGKYICEHYDKAAYMTASKLGESVGVSESTVVRFAVGMGFEGYPEFQSALRELIRTRLTAVQRIEITDERIGKNGGLDSVLTSDIDKIKSTLEHIDREAFDAAVDALIGARNIYIMGARTSAMLANFLGFNLKLIFDNVRQLQTTGGNEIFEQLIRLGEDDVVFAISFPRYSKRIVNALEYSKSCGAKIIGLTDSNSSPLAQSADYLLTAQSDMASFVDSLVAPLSLINALIVAIASKKKNELSETFTRLEDIWRDYDFYDKN